MAEVRADDRAGACDFEFRVALAAHPGKRPLASRDRNVWRRGCLCLVAAALVPGILPGFNAAWICHQPGWGPGRAPVLFPFHPYTVRPDFTAGGKGRFATPDAAPGDNLLANGQTLWPAGPAFLTAGINKTCIDGSPAAKGKPGAGRCPYHRPTPVGFRFRALMGRARLREGG